MSYRVEARSVPSEIGRDSPELFRSSASHKNGCRHDDEGDFNELEIDLEESCEAVVLQVEMDDSKSEELGSVSALELETLSAQVGAPSATVSKSSDFSQRCVTDSQAVAKAHISSGQISQDGLTALNQAVGLIRSEDDNPVVATIDIGKAPSSTVKGTLSKNSGSANNKKSTDAMNRDVVNAGIADPEMECFQLSGTPATRGSMASQHEAQDSLANMPLSATPQRIEDTAKTTNKDSVTGKPTKNASDDDAGANDEEVEDKDNDTQDPKCNEQDVRTRLGQSSQADLFEATPKHRGGGRDGGNDYTASPSLLQPSINSASPAAAHEDLRSVVLSDMRSHPRLPKKLSSNCSSVTQQDSEPIKPNHDVDKSLVEGEDRPTDAISNGKNEGESENGSECTVESTDDEEVTTLVAPARKATEGDSCGANQITGLTTPRKENEEAGSALVTPTSELVDMTSPKWDSQMETPTSLPRMAELQRTDDVTAPNDDVGENQAKDDETAALDPISNATSDSALQEAARAVQVEISQEVPQSPRSQAREKEHTGSHDDADAMSHKASSPVVAGVAESTQDGDCRGESEKGDTVDAVVLDVPSPAACDATDSDSEAQSGDNTKGESNEKMSRARSRGDDASEPSNKASTTVAGKDNVTAAVSDPDADAIRPDMLVVSCANHQSTTNHSDTIGGTKSEKEPIRSPSKSSVETGSETTAIATTPAQHGDASCGVSTRNHNAVASAVPEGARSPADAVIETDGAEETVNPATVVSAMACEHASPSFTRPGMPEQPEMSIDPFGLSGQEGRISDTITTKKTSLSVMDTGPRPTGHGWSQDSLVSECSGAVPAAKKKSTALRRTTSSSMTVSGDERADSDGGFLFGTTDSLDLKFEETQPTDDDACGHSEEKLSASNPSAPTVSVRKQSDGCTADAVGPAARGRTNNQCSTSNASTTRVSCTSANSCPSVSADPNPTVLPVSGTNEDTEKGAIQADGVADRGVAGKIPGPTTAGALETGGVTPAVVSGKAPTNNAGFTVVASGNGDSDHGRIMTDVMTDGENESDIMKDRPSKFCKLPDAAHSATSTSSAAEAKQDGVLDDAKDSSIDIAGASASAKGKGGIKRNLLKRSTSVVGKRIKGARVKSALRDARHTHPAQEIDRNRAISTDATNDARTGGQGKSATTPTEQPGFVTAFAAAVPVSAINRAGAAVQPPTTSSACPDAKRVARRDDSEAGTTVEHTAERDYEPDRSSDEESLQSFRRPRLTTRRNVVDDAAAKMGSPEKPRARIRPVAREHNTSVHENQRAHDSKRVSPADAAVVSSITSAKAKKVQENGAGTEDADPGAPTARRSSSAHGNVSSFKNSMGNAGQNIFPKENHASATATPSTSPRQSAALSALSLKSRSGALDTSVAAATASASANSRDGILRKESLKRKHAVHATADVTSKRILTASSLTPNNADEEMRENSPANESSECWENTPEWNLDNVIAPVTKLPSLPVRAKHPSTTATPATGPENMRAGTGDVTARSTSPRARPTGAATRVFPAKHTTANAHATEAAGRSPSPDAPLPLMHDDDGMTSESHHANAAVRSSKRRATVPDSASSHPSVRAGAMHKRPALAAAARTVDDSSSEDGDGATARARRTAPRRRALSKKGKQKRAHPLRNVETVVPIGQTKRYSGASPERNLSTGRRGSPALQTRTPSKRKRLMPSVGRDSSERVVPTALTREASHRREPTPHQGLVRPVQRGGEQRRSVTPPSRHEPCALPNACAPSDMTWTMGEIMDKTNLRKWFRHTKVETCRSKVTETATVVKTLDAQGNVVNEEKTVVRSGPTVCYPGWEIESESKQRIKNPQTEIKWCKRSASSKTSYKTNSTHSHAHHPSAVGRRLSPMVSSTSSSAAAADVGSSTDGTVFSLQDSNVDASDNAYDAVPVATSLSSKETRREARRAAKVKQRLQAAVERLPNRFIFRASNEDIGKTIWAMPSNDDYYYQATLHTCYKNGNLKVTFADTPNRKVKVQNAFRDFCISKLPKGMKVKALDPDATTTKNVVEYIAADVIGFNKANELQVCLEERNDIYTCKADEIAIPAQFFQTAEETGACGEASEAHENDLDPDTSFSTPHASQGYEEEESPVLVSASKTSPTHTPRSADRKSEVGDGATHASSSRRPKNAVRQDLFASYGRIPELSMLFQGYYFVLSGFEPQHKAHVVKQLGALGGVVCESLLDVYGPSNDAQDTHNRHAHCILLHDDAKRTKKVLECTAAGVPCVSYKWLAEICESNIDDDATCMGVVALPPFGNHLGNCVRDPQTPPLFHGASVIVIGDDSQEKEAAMFQKDILPLAGVTTFVTKSEFQKGWSSANPDWGGCDYIISLGKKLPDWATIKSKEFGITILHKDTLSRCFELQEKP
eukprot:m.1479335 g.1479335  ORF g.1479335 m.1479335 type:complete len:2389 (-) comp25168_c0_seq6:1-7167(-)